MAILVCASHSFGLERLEFYEEHMNLLLPAVFLRRGLQAASALCLSASTDVNEQMLRFHRFLSLYAAMARLKKSQVSLKLVLNRV